MHIIKTNAMLVMENKALRADNRFLFWAAVGAGVIALATAVLMVRC